jgi:hypothetical protein
MSDRTARCADCGTRRLSPLGQLCPDGWVAHRDGRFICDACLERLLNRYFSLLAGRPARLSAFVKGLKK